MQQLDAVPGVPDVHIYKTAEEGEKQVTADINLVGTLSAEVMAEAIHKAVITAQIPDDEFLKDCLG